MPYDLHTYIREICANNDAIRAYGILHEVIMMENLFNALADMYIEETFCDGQLFCGCRRKDCVSYKTEECKKCLIKQVKENIKE